MQKMNVTELIPHPQNDYYFDDIQGQKWTEFLESVKTSGIIEPIICNQNKVVISGHQRLRACKKLGINEVLVDTRIYDNEESIIKDLIETNIRQRGDINSSGLKLGRIIKTLEEAYGIKNGGNGSNQYATSDNVGTSSQEDLAKQLNISVDTLNNYKKLTTLIPELQELSLEGNITTSVASRVLARLTQEEQLELFNELGEDKLKEMTQKEVKEYIDKNNRLEQELRVEKNKPREIITETIDNTDYSIVDKLNKIQKEFEDKKIESERLGRRLELAQQKADAYEQDSNDYRKMKDEITYLTQQKDDLGRQIKSITDISGLLEEINNLIKNKLAPVKYSKSLLEAKDDEIVIRNLTDMVQVVQQWCDEMKKYIPNKINYVEVI
jgi:ParB family transcriptional regulator, chromosome partitioning protein